MYHGIRDITKIGNFALQAAAEKPDGFEIKITKK
jgi:hypothetical protein